MSKEIILPDTIVDIIQEIVEAIKFENNLSPIIKDDVFELLENRCTVIYYPLKNEYNRGFHIKRFVGDKLEDFVYINTDKTIEQQIFTAAHELGHVFGIYGQVINIAFDKGIELDAKDKDYEEKVTDRFAAKFVMPRKEFIEHTKNYAKELSLSKKVSVLKLLILISKLMDDFMSPFDAVRKRLNEIHAINMETDRYLSEKKDEFSKYIDFLKRDKNYIINGNTEVKTISGLRTFIEMASNNSNTDKVLIEKIKKDFELKEIELTDQIMFSGEYFE
ncbi:protein of unknown function [Lachnospiraceae bacterium]|nr:protein of unknown function [Lachnospiraceae bacterium]